LNKIFSLISLLPLLLDAQNERPAYVQGRITERQREHGLSHVLLHLPEIKLRAEADSAGEFLLPVPANRVLSLEIRRWGYFAQSRRLPAIAAGETLLCNVVLVPSPITFKGVEIVGEKWIEKNPAMISQAAEHALRQPGAFEDPLRALQQIPGVSMRSDWDSQISVRGATPDQNLVVIDGFILPNPYRLQFALGGGLSLLQAGILQQAELWKSGFSVRYGDRVAGLVSLQTQSPLQPRRFEVRLNVFDASVSASLPGRRNGVLLAVRRNYHDALSGLAPLRGFAIPRWQDVQIKLAHQISPHHQIEMFTLLSKEWLDLELGETDKFNIQENAQSFFSGLSSRWALASELIWKNHLSHFQAPTDIYFRNTSDPDSTAATYDFDDRLWAWRSELTKQQNVRTQWLMGAELNRQRQWVDLRSRFDNRDSPLVLSQDYHGRRRRTLAAFYLENKFVWSAKFILQPGLRWAGELGRSPLRSEPRLSVSGAWPRFNYLVHAGRYRQTLDWQSLFRREWPMDVSGWRALPEEQAWLFSAESVFSLSLTVELALGVYHRQLDPLIVLIDESEGMILELREFGTPQFFEEPLVLQANRPRVSRGNYQGLEAAWSLTRRNWNLAWRYSFSRSRMRDLDDQNWIAAATDRPHDAALDGSLKLFSGVELRGHVRYTSGNPYSPVIALAPDQFHRRWPEGYRFIYAPRNSGRYPDYFRGDLRAGYAFQGPGGDWQIYFECLNLTNRENIYQILWTSSSERGVVPNVAKRKIPMLPRLFLGGIAIRF